MRAGSLLACCVLVSSAAAHAGNHRIFPLSFDLHEKRSVAIAGIKSPHDPRLDLLTSFRPEEQQPDRPKIKISGKRLKFSLPF
jgi:hypothetical protein